MDRICNHLFTILITLHLTHAANTVIRIYTNVGDNLTLPLSMCRYDGSMWDDPCLASTECKTYTMTYYDGLMKYPNLPTNINLITDTAKEEGNYVLQIFNISFENEGLYIVSCFYENARQDKKYEVVFSVKPSNLFIENEFDGKIVGTAGYPLDIICRVTSGVPPENMTMYQEQTVVKKGGPGTIAYSLIPTQANDGVKFSCVVQSDALETAMEHTVYLDIQYRPVVECADESISVVEGDNLTVQCLAQSNPPPTDVRITRHGVKLKQCPQSPCSLKRKSSRNDSGIYWCIAYNQIGKGNNCHTNVNILYPPAVSVVILNDATLRCSATAEPNNATYLPWQHINDLGEVRQYNGSEYFELCSLCKRYMVNGLYRCSATNGIRDTDGNNISFGNVFVQLKGTPEILPKTKSIQYGKYKKDVAVEIFVYSTTKVTIERILRNGDLIETSGRLVTNNSFRNEYKVTYHIDVLREVDFTKYTFEVKNDQGAIKFNVSLEAKDGFCPLHIRSKNDQGAVYFNVSLEAKDIPETPEITHLTVKDYDVTVHFTDNFDGGLPQVFVLQYGSILNWTSVTINDTFDGVGSFTIQNLVFGHMYYLRMYSVNSLGKSSFSEVRSILLSGESCEGKNSITCFVGISVGSSIFGALVSMFVYRCCQKIRKRSNLNIAPTNINAEIEVQYDEIDGGHLHEMEEIRVNLRRQGTNGLTDSAIGTETENENLNVTNENNVEIETETENATNEINIVEEDEDGLDTILSDDNSNSDDSSDLPRHIYINVPQSAGNQYQSLVDSKTGNNEENNYDPLNAGTRLETHYYNFRI